MERKKFQPGWSEVIEKILEQYKRGFITTQEARLEITEVLFMYLTKKEYLKEKYPTQYKGN